MKSALVLTVIGPDRPGLVETLAATVAEHGGNWEQSRMARLGGQFAGILKVSVPDRGLGGLHRALEGLANVGLRIVSEATTHDAEPELRVFQLELVGDDREGIVREVARTLASRGVNVEQLDTRVESAAMSGGLLFRATARLRVPEGQDVEQLQKALEALADDLMVDVQLLPAGADAG